MPIRSSRFRVLAREGALNKLSPALGAGLSARARIGGREGGRYKVEVRFGLSIGDVGLL